MPEQSKSMTEFSDEKPSKSQKKRDMQALRELAGKLLELGADDVAKIPDQHIQESVTAGKKITKGNARKRQLQYIAKLLSKTDIEPIAAIIDVLDASTTHHLQVFHRFESWRERLIDGEPTVMSEIFDAHPQTDRPKLRSLVRNAVAEKERGEQGTHFRALFQFLKTLD